MKWVQVWDWSDITHQFLHEELIGGLGRKTLLQLAFLGESDPYFPQLNQSVIGRENALPSDERSDKTMCLKDLPEKCSLSHILDQPGPFDELELSQRKWLWTVNNNKKIVVWRVVYLVCTCGLANHSLSLKSWQHVDSTQGNKVYEISKRNVNLSLHQGLPYSLEMKFHISPTCP